jgi:ubiquinone/menaquinone biosynthesis C-methylase UbiE
MELDRADVKEYFKKEKTVSEWWDPEEKPGLFKELYIEQRKIVGSLFDAKNKIVLDAGTGKGRFAIDFADAGAECVYASDLSEEMLEIAKKRAGKRGVDGKIKFQSMDIENLQYEDNFFDFVCCMETFVHLPHPQQAMNELSRVTKPGGLVVGSVTLPIKRWYLNAERVSNLDQLFEWLFTPIYESNLYQNVIRRILRRPALVGRPLPTEYFQSLFTNSGLSILKLVYLGHPRAPHFVLVAARK